jgi:uncharacterized protein (TIGR03790 family)
MYGMSAVISIITRFLGPRTVFWCSLFCLLFPRHANAAGSGLNTIVVVNQSSSNSCELGNYYCEQRQVPPENLFRINWPGGNVSWAGSDFTNVLLNPLLAMVAARQLTNQAEYVVLSMDIPFQTVNGSFINSTTAALFYGLKPDPVFGTAGVTNSYASSESPFRQAQPVTAVGYSFLAVMITADTLAQAKQLVDRGVASDATFPSQPVCLAKTSDPARNVRYKLFDNAIFNSRIRGSPVMFRTNSDSVSGYNVLGYETGLANFSVSSAAFVPGAMADALTSKGGIIFGGNDQTSLLAFTEGGASGSYGTVTEPYADTSRFPNPQAYFYQARGFSLSECYYQALNSPFLGLIVAEPLAAPFQQPASGQWLETNAQPTLSGIAQLGLSFNTAAQAPPLAQVDLFIDGKYFQTLTNIPPTPGNVLTVTVNGFPVTYTVPTNASLSSVAAGLAAALNDPANTNLTHAAASVHGDRLELRLLSTNRMSDSFYFVDGAGAANIAYRTTYLPEPVPPQMSPVPPAANGTLKLHCQSPAASMPYVILASTNLSDWIPIHTNLSGAPEDFSDPGASKFTRRFFRIVGLWPNQRPKLSLLRSNTGTCNLHAETAGALPYTIQASSNLADWFPIFTNAAGGPADFSDALAGTSAMRFYRASAGFNGLPPPSFSVLNGQTNGVSVLQMAATPWPYRVEASCDLTNWFSLFTNLTIRGGQTEASSSSGDANPRTTYLSASLSSFQDSLAYGFRGFDVYGHIQSNSVLQVLITKTNGQLVSLSVTNQGGTMAALTQRLLDLINTSPDLQGSDGLVAEDIIVDVFGEPTFNLRARSAGLQAAAMQVYLATSDMFYVDPWSATTLTQNLADLQPRNHLYVSAGVFPLLLNFSLDTSTLPDGFHDFTAVAYEGTSVRTQTRAVMPVQVHNSDLNATMTLTDLPDTAPVQGLYHIQVAANTNTISAIRLFCTGGQFAVATNQTSATFTVDGSLLGAGLHPFYALIETADGLRYRTETHKVRLVNGP